MCLHVTKELVQIVFQKPNRVSAVGCIHFIILFALFRTSYVLQLHMVLKLIDNAFLSNK